MVRKINSCVFISGNGSNLKSIIDSSRDYNFPLIIKLVISSNSNAYGIKYAKKYNIPYKFFKSENQNHFERNCLHELRKKKNKVYLLSWIYENFIKKFY